MLLCPSFNHWGFFMNRISTFISLISCLVVISSASAGNDNCLYFSASTCIKDAKAALATRLSTLESGQFKIGQHTTFCGALDESDSETILYKYQFSQVTGPNSLQLKAEVEITLNLDECVNPVVTILN
jgi:hypothetical protein